MLQSETSAGSGVVCDGLPRRIFPALCLVLDRIGRLSYSLCTRPSEIIMSADLFEPFQFGDLTPANRMVTAPMTRNRADENGVVPPMMVTYYQQRASAGLDVTQSAPVSPEGVGYPATPGICTDAQSASWLCVTDAVHSAGGHVFVQLQRCGRISHPSLLPNNATPVGPSALRPTGQAVTYTGMQDFVTPRALETGEIPGIVARKLKQPDP